MRRVCSGLDGQSYCRARRARTLAGTPEGDFARLVPALICHPPHPCPSVATLLSRAYWEKQRDGRASWCGVTVPWLASVLRHHRGMSRGPCDCPEELLGLPHVHSPCRAQDAAAAARAQPCAHQSGYTGGTSDTHRALRARAGPRHPLGMALLEIQARRLESPALGARITCPGERWGNEQTWVFPGAERLWGGSGCWHWHESTVMGLGWQCHRVIPRLVALGARAAWGWVLPCPAATPGARPGAGQPPPAARGCSLQGWDHLSLSVGS